MAWDQMEQRRVVPCLRQVIHHHGQSSSLDVGEMVVALGKLGAT